MNGTGRNQKQSNYLVVLLLVVGLTAFSNSMKQLSELHQLVFGAGELLAHWSEPKAPVEIKIPTEIPQTVVKVESCDVKQSLPEVALSWLHNDETKAPVVPAPRRVESESLARRVRGRSVEAPVAKSKKTQVFNIDGLAFEVHVPTEQNDESAVPAVGEFPMTMFKVRNRRQPSSRTNPRDRDILLKTLNRSINLRIAS